MSPDVERISLDLGLKANHAFGVQKFRFEGLRTLAFCGLLRSIIGH